MSNASYLNLDLTRPVLILGRITPTPACRGTAAIPTHSILHTLLEEGLANTHSFNTQAQNIEQRVSSRATREIGRTEATMTTEMSRHRRATTAGSISLNISIPHSTGIAANKVVPTLVHIWLVCTAIAL